MIYSVPFASVLILKNTRRYPFMMREIRSGYSWRITVLVFISSAVLLSGCLKISGPLHDGKAGGYYKTGIAVKGGTGNYLFTLESGGAAAGLKSGAKRDCFRHNRNRRHRCLYL